MTQNQRQQLGGAESLDALFVEAFAGAVLRRKAGDRHGHVAKICDRYDRTAAKAAIARIF
jgi:hypothetical protein